MSVRKRAWTTPSGEAKTAWVVDYMDTTGKRRLKTFKLREQADAFARNSLCNDRLGEGTNLTSTAQTVIVKDIHTKLLELGAAIGRMISRSDHEKEG